MNESSETKKQHFKYPDIYKEEGELKRVALEFGVEPSVLEFLAQQGQLVELTEDIWKTLENTDSNEIELSDWQFVEFLADQVNRDWQTLRKKLESGQAMEAPIIMKKEDRYYLVAGNTRLMVAKALGLKPSAFVFEIE